MLGGSQSHPGGSTAPCVLPRYRGAGGGAGGVWEWGGEQAPPQLNRPQVTPFERRTSYKKSREQLSSFVTRFGHGKRTLCLEGHFSEI